MKQIYEATSIKSPSLDRRTAIAGMSSGLLALTLPGCATRRGPSSRVVADAEDAAGLLDRIAWNFLERSPMTATTLGVDTGDHSYLRARMNDTSPDGQAALAEGLRKDLATIAKCDRSGLAPTVETSLEVIESCYRTALDGLALPYGDVAVGSWRNTPYVVVQNVGGYLDYPRFMDSDHPIRDKADVGAYLARLSGIPAALHGELERALSARAMGLVPPAFLLDKAIAQMESSLADATTGGELVGSLTRRIIATWGEQALGEAGEHAHLIVTREIAPALAAQLEELRLQRQVATNDAGMWARPQGDEWYAWALRASTTTGMTPDELHRMGRDELAELHGRMEPILQSLGYTKGTVGERMAALARDPRFRFAPEDEGRAQIMEFIEQRLSWIKAQMPRAFGKQARGNVEVRRLPLSEEPGAPVAYGGPGSIDGTVPGKMWVNLRTTDLHTTFSLPTLVHHETIPGHVWEGEFSQKLPLIRAILAFNAFTEGWALYAEQLADELGAYDQDPVGRLGYLQSLAFRACRLVIDTGLHAKRWTRDEAIRWFMATNGNGYEEVANEVDRYCSWPGQACGYKVGHTSIVRQRARAMEALGSRYDLRTFDDAVVAGGNVPMDVLARNVDRYIAAQRD